MTKVFEYERKGNYHKVGTEVRGSEGKLTLPKAVRGVRVKGCFKSQLLRSLK